MVNTANGYRLFHILNLLRACEVDENTTHDIHALVATLRSLADDIEANGTWGITEVQAIIEMHTRMPIQA